MFFQKTIIKKYHSMLPKEQLEEAWQKYQTYFLNSEIQGNILQSKEEQFQEGFLRELFVKILGYTLNPSPDYNLITEQKNETDAKKADGAILLNGTVVGVIELKDHKTTDLKKVEPQAFLYKSQNKDARYVIISNFEKLRLYIDNATEHREWNLFKMSEADFQELYCCLAWTQVQKGIAIQMKEASVSIEKSVTDVLYKDYSSFKRELFEDILENNPTQEMETKEWQLLLYKKTQKLLDRLLFIFFAEDGGLLPPNLMVQILDEWKQIKELDIEMSLYQRIKQYFGYLNAGNPKKDIFAYNGGLFRPDEVLDALTISDELLYKHTRKLSEYDFKSDVDVNILGHIFEHSLSEIEEVTQRIMGVEVDASQSKRKKDGLFYTPPYITKYIVENTVGKLCAEKKQELGIKEEEYFSDRKRQKQTKLQLLEQLRAYREWLLQITILDPACGSGAFLNAALSFLMDEHHLVDEMEAKVAGSSIVFQDIENSILENNLFGVDINEESVEIAQLALWLRTAKPQRKLNSLNKNIKCGNSLISDPTIAGDKAFDWEKEFPQVFANGGFDVVIGNPPYVLCQPSNTPPEMLNYYKIYEVASYKIDLFHLFYEKGIKLLKYNGKFGFITPNTYLTNTYIESLRKFLLSQQIETLTIHSNGVFNDASVDVATLTLSKKNTEKEVLIRTMDEHGDTTNEFMISQDVWENNTNHIFSITKQFNFNRNNCISLGDIASVTFGLQTKDKDTYVKTNKIDDIWEPCYTGKDISRYLLANSSLYFKNKPDEVKAGGSWDMNIHHSKKIVVRQIGAPEPIFAYDKEGNATLNTMYSIVVNNEYYSDLYVLSILSSSAIKKWWLSRYIDNKNLFPKIKGGQLKTIPVPILSLDEQSILVNLAKQILALHEQLQEKQSRFLRRLKDNFDSIKITGALTTFDQLEFADFLKELKKQKITLKLSQQDEWEEYFNDYRTECRKLSEQIKETDREIDLRVYKLYGLTYDEVLIVDADFEVSREEYNNRG